MLSLLPSNYPSTYVCIVERLETFYIWNFQSFTSTTQHLFYYNNVGMWITRPYTISFYFILWMNAFIFSELTESIYLPHFNHSYLFYLKYEFLPSIHRWIDRTNKFHVVHLCLWCSVLYSKHYERVQFNFIRFRIS